jgi:hypothetical protein
MPTLDSFSAASQGALADINAANADTPAPAPVEAAPPAPAPPSAQSPDSTPAPPSDTPPASEEWEIKWNGQNLKVTREQAIRLAQQGFDYTQKTQQIAEERRASEQREAQYQAQLSQLAQALRNPDFVRKHYETLLQESGQSLDPNEVPTMAQMQQALRAESDRIKAEAKAETEKVVAAATARLESMRMESDYTHEAEQTLGQVIEKHDILKTIDDVEDLLRKDAWRAIVAKQKVDPDYAPSKEDVRKAIIDSAKTRAEKLESKIKDHEKMAVARQAKLTTHGTEPPGGKPVAPVSTQKYRLGSKDLTKAAIEDIEAAMRAATS